MPGKIDYELLSISATPDNEGWWAGTREHKLLVQQCKSCGYKQFPPLPYCPECQSSDLGWFETSGKGVVHSYLVVTQPILAAFRYAVPYVTALVELPDCRNADGSGCRIGGVMLDDEDAVGIGSPVEVVFEPTASPEFVMPRWKVCGPGEDVWHFKG